MIIRDNILNIVFGNNFKKLFLNEIVNNSAEFDLYDFSKKQLITLQAESFYCYNNTIDKSKKVSLNTIKLLFNNKITFNYPPKLSSISMNDEEVFDYTEFYLLINVKDYENSILPLTNIHNIINDYINNSSWSNKASIKMCNLMQSEEFKNFNKDLLTTSQRECLKNFKSQKYSIQDSLNQKFEKFNFADLTIL